MLRYWVIFLLAAFPAASHASEPPRGEVSVPLADVLLKELERDSSGGIWSILEAAVGDTASGGYGVNFPALATFDHLRSAWKICGPNRSAPSARPRNLIPLQDGRMACIWEMGESLLLTRASVGDYDKPWCRFERRVNTPVFLPLRHGGLVITGRAPFFLYLHKDSVAPAEIPIPEPLWRRSSPNQGTGAENQDWANVSALECADGSLVLWHSTLQPSPWRPQLKGLVRWLPKEGRFEAHQPFGPNTEVSALIQDGPDHLLAAVLERGLFRISLADFSVQLMPGPLTGNGVHPFDYIEKLSWTGGRLYVVTCPQPAITEITSSSQGLLLTSRTTFHPLRSRTGILWGWDWRRAAFKPLIQGLDREPRFGWTERPLLAVGRGLLAGSFLEQPWWLPRRGVDQGFQLEEAHGLRPRSAWQLEPLPSGHGLMARDVGGYAAISPLPGIAPEGSVPRLRSLLTESSPVRDRNGHLWAFGVLKMAFAEWDGKTWINHPLPSEMRDGQLGRRWFEADGSNQAWLLPNGAGKSAVFDFVNAEWEVFSSLAAAVEARLLPGDEVRGRGGRIVGGPLSAVDGAKGFFLRTTSQAFVFMEGKWHQAEWKTITGGKEGNTDGPPFFSKDGAFCLPFGRAAYRTMDGEHWSLETRIEDPSRIAWEANDPSPPEGGWGIDGVQSATWDDAGVVWLITREGHLWKSMGGKQVPVLDHGRPLILPEGASISQVLRDGSGNTFLVGGQGGYCFRNLILSPISLPIHPPSLEVIPGKSGKNLLRTGAPPPGTWLRWRVDEASWSGLGQSPDGVVGLPILPPGPHVVEVAAFDEELSPLGKTRTLTFEVSALDESGLLALVEQLRSGNPDEREAAARILRIQPPSALPLLQKTATDPATSETLRWWLQAVIQGIQNRHAQGKGGIR